MDFKYSYNDFLYNSEYVLIKDTKTGYESYGLKDWIRKRYNFSAAYYGINTNSSSNKKRHKLIEPRPGKKIISYKTKKDISCSKHRNICYIKFKKSLPIYKPNKEYIDNNEPYLGINQYNKKYLEDQKNFYYRNSVINSFDNFFVCEMKNITMISFNFNNYNECIY